MKPPATGRSSSSPASGVQLEAHPRGVIVPVHAQPGARIEGISGLHGGALKISVKQVPEKGKANKRLAEFLAHALRVSKSQVELLGGTSSRQKRFLVQGLTLSELEARLASLWD